MNEMQRTGPDPLLFGGNIIACIIHLATAAAVIALVAVGKLDWVAEVGVTYVDPSVVPSTYTFSLWYTYNPAILVAVLSIVTGLAHALAAACWPTYEWYSISSRTRPAGDQTHVYIFSWIEYSISASLMMVCLLSITGVREFPLLLCGGVAIGALNLLGLAGELALVGTRWNLKKRFWSPAVISSLVTCAVAWILLMAPWSGLFIYFFTALANQDSVPVFLWVLIFNLFFQFASFGFVYVAQNWVPVKDDGPARRRKFALIYIALSLTAKQSLAWNLVIGLMTR